MTKSRVKLLGFYFVPIKVQMIHLLPRCIDEHMKADNELEPLQIIYNINYFPP